MRRFCWWILLMAVLSVNAQSGRKITRQEYINTYKDLAMREMERSGIPASITLAQGLLESGDGNSTLARSANNHFGIKCHDWTGKSIKIDDDHKNECFRKYKSVEESYTDHSDFLKGRSRYAELFTHSPDDYKAWAKGLKKAGYATSPTYATALIKIIEENELYKYDREVIARMEGGQRKKNVHSEGAFAGSRKIYYNNRVKYILAREGDSFISLSSELDMLPWQLPKYNELPENSVFREGDVVYLQPKRNKAETGKNTHVVKEGETLPELSRLYAIKLDRLAQNNMLDVSDSLIPGTKLLLRSKQKITAPKLIIPQTQKVDETKEVFIIEFDAGE